MSKSVIATTRCEVDGEVKLPGDKFTCTDQQYAFLQSKNAVADARSGSALASAGATLSKPTRREKPEGGADQ